MIFADWCVLFTMFLPWFVAGYGKYKGGGLNPEANHDPRGFFAKSSGLVSRANAAQQNCYEIFPLFAFVVLLAQYNNVTATTINLLATLFVISRLAYIWCYLSDRAMLRSAIWGVGVLCILALFFSAL